MAASSLPIEPLLPEIVQLVEHHPLVVVVAEPGAGKTTRVPGALLRHFTDGEIWVLEPRRLAVRLAARHVAAETGEPVGQLVGYHVRFEDVSSRDTRLRFMTEGVLSRRLFNTQELHRVRVVVFDEFHERHLAADLALAYLIKLQQTTHPSLRIVVMSATLDANLVAQRFECPIVRVAGRQHPVAVEYLGSSDAVPLEKQVVKAVHHALTDHESKGDILAFLPGVGEINRTCSALQALDNVRVVPLFGNQSPAAQDMALQATSERKVIVSTNVAETSVTLPNVTTVIDSGLVRMAGFDPWSGLPSLRVQPISKASAVQRAGRAGRVQSGKCLRLFSEAEFSRRRPHDAAEVLRLDLAETVLQLHGMGVPSVEALPWLEEPPKNSVLGAEQLLFKLGALDASKQLTTLGRQMLEFPVHPRLGRLILEANRKGQGARGCLIAALLGERDLFPKLDGAKYSGASDVLAAAALFERLRAANFHGAKVGVPTVHRDAAQQIADSQAQLQRVLRQIEPGRTQTDASADDALLYALLAAYPDRVGYRQPAPPHDVVLASGGRFRLSPSSAAHTSEYLVAISADAALPGQGTPFIRSASGIEVEWLLEVCPSVLTETTEVEWNAKAERVEQTYRLRYDGLMLEEKRQLKQPSAATAALLFKMAQTRGLSHFVDEPALSQFVARVNFARDIDPTLGFPTIDENAVKATLEQMCQHATSFADLRALSLLASVRDQVPAELQARLFHLAPESIVLASGRRVPIHYEAAKSPWIESALQDFFGQKQSPTLMDGRVPLTVHLLAPNRRAVQITTDLAGFWVREYPALRKQLSRRYPRHAWPEDPLTAVPGSRPRSR